MLAVNATDVRKDFGNWIDTVVRKKPVFVKRSRDYFVGMNIETLKELVGDVEFTVNVFTEEDGSVTLSLRDFGIVVNEHTKDKATGLLIADLREYVEEYFDEPDFWGSDIKRKKQLRSLIKVLITENNRELKGCFVWQDGES